MSFLIEPGSQLLKMSGTSITLQLLPTNFIADSSSGQFGYERDFAFDQLAKTESTLLGDSAIKASQFEPKLSFKWSLLLTLEQTVQLEALIALQQARLSRRLANYAIILQDQRLAYSEPSPRSRAKIGALITSPAPPSGFTFYASQFSLLLTPSEGWRTLWGYIGKNKPLFSIELSAIELSKVPLSEDA